ncbi:hypothetical protein CQW23_32586 [Capsicum baccatum]|uniref:Disease resistance protein winged helix domain-containing protein n=1 Tax=Capsicum baccatum TaxID=33114 RepID=A0A2G2V4A1_CAPBA|nr:hypothetical protein CQW23_32586 [Capsicum baccatum]
MAHAIVASLMRTIESLLISNSPMQSLIPKQELCALREKVSSLELFVKNFEKNNVSGEMTDFEVEVKQVASAVEYTIQLRLTETVVGENKSIIGIIGSIFFKGISNIWTRRKFRKSLQQLAKDIDHVWKETTKIQDKGKQVSKEPLVHDFASSTNDILNVNNNMVGRDDLKELLLEDLTITYPDEHKVIPIVGMGGIREIDDWESVAKDVKSFVTNDPDKQCSRVLGLSYNHLTSDLKTCLLHFGIFPEDSYIPVKRLVRSWMAEGFLKLENDLEGEAEKCLQELVDRCLVLVCKKSLDGTKIRSCKVHDIIYALCLREIQRENIFIMNDIVPLYADFPYPSRQKMQPFKCVTGDKINDYCRYSHYRALLTPVHRQLRDHDNNDLVKRTHSIFSFHISFLSPLLKSELIHFKFLKVLELRHEIYNFPLEILSLIWLRYLSLLCLENFRIPPEIYRLWNLQTFIVQGRGRSILISFPEEIWGLMQLRHLKLPQFYLPNPPRVSADKGSHMGFSTLLQEEGYETDLSIRDSGLLNNLVHLQQLETLGIKLCFNLLPASAKAFPAALKKLKLEATALSWSYLDIIAKLPNLEVLKLMCGACRGDEWHPNVRGFTRLKFLLIADDSLKYWMLAHMLLGL